MAGDPADVADDLRRRLNEIERGRLEQEHNDLARVLSLREGRRFLWRLITESGALGASYTKGDAHDTAYREGQRDQGLKLVRLITSIDRMALSRLAAEGAEDDARHENARRAILLEADLDADA